MSDATGSRPASTASSTRSSRKPKSSSAAAADQPPKEPSSPLSSDLSMDGDADGDAARVADDVDMPDVKEADDDELSRLSDEDGELGDDDADEPSQPQPQALAAAVQGDDADDVDADEDDDDDDDDEGSEKSSITSSTEPLVNDRDAGDDGATSGAASPVSAGSERKSARPLASTSGDVTQGDADDDAELGDDDDDDEDGEDAVGNHAAATPASALSENKADDSAAQRDDDGDDDDDDDLSELSWSDDGDLASRAISKEGREEAQGSLSPASTANTDLPDAAERDGDEESTADDNAVAAAAAAEVDVSSSVPGPRNRRDSLRDRVNQELRKRIDAGAGNQDDGDADSLDEMLEQDRRAARKKGELADGRPSSAAQDDDEEMTDLGDDEEDGSGQRDAKADAGATVKDGAVAQNEQDAEDDPELDEEIDAAKQKVKAEVRAAANQVDRRVSVSGSASAPNKKMSLTATNAAMEADMDDEVVADDDEDDEDATPKPGGADASASAEDPDAQSTAETSKDEPSKPSSGSPSPAPDRAASSYHTSTLSSAPSAPTIEATQALMSIEIKLAALRDQLYVERMDELAREERTILEGTHPSLLLLHHTLSDRKDKLFQLGDLRTKKMEDELVKIRTTDEEAVWTWYHDAKRKLIDDEYEANARKKRRIDRDAAELVTQRPLPRPIPPREPTSADRLVRTFDWRKGSAISSLGSQDIVGDLTQMGLGPRMQPYAYPSVHPAAGPRTYGGMVPHHAANAMPANPGPYGRSVHGVPDEAAFIDHNGMLYQAQPQQQHAAQQPQSRYANGGQGSRRQQALVPAMLDGPPPRREGRTVPTHTADPFDRKRERTEDTIVGKGNSSKTGSSSVGRRIDSGLVGPGTYDEGPSMPTGSGAKRRKAGGMGVDSSSTSMASSSQVYNPLIRHAENGADARMNGGGRMDYATASGSGPAERQRRSPSPSSRSLGKLPHSSVSSQQHSPAALRPPTSLLAQQTSVGMGANPRGEWLPHRSQIAPVPPPLGVLRPPDLVDHRSRILNG